LCGAVASDEEWNILETRTHDWWSTFIDSDPKNHWVKIVKYKVSAFVAWLLNQDDEGNLPTPPPGVPKTDHPAVLFGGKIYRWTRILRNRSRARALVLAQTVNQAKFGMPKPDELLVALSVRSTFEKLTTPKPPPPAPMPVYDWSDTDDEDWLLPFDGPHTMLSEEIAKSEIRRTVREVFCGVDRNGRTIGPRAKDYESSSMNQEKVPSTSSSYDTRIKDGGNFAYIHHWWQDVLAGSLVRFGDPDPIEIEVEITHPFKPLLVYDASKLRAESNLYRYALRQKAADSPSYTRVVGLSEALKVRPITQGNPFQQTALDTLQKWLHTTVKQNPAFSLIGEEVTAEYVNKRLGTRPLAPDEVFISGDYAAATDGMYARYSAVVPDVLHEEGLIDDLTYILMMDNLIGNRIENPTTGEVVHQEEGQLMGSITSFPVLCLVNGALCRWALECQFRRSFTLKDAPMMINGDDNLWRGRWIRSHTPRFCRSPLRFFEDVCKYFSFELSVGKTFQSREVAVINSVMFRAANVVVDGHTRMGLTRVNYFPMSPFATNRGRSGPPDSLYRCFDDVDLMPLGIGCPLTWRKLLPSLWDSGDETFRRAVNMSTLTWINQLRCRFGAAPLKQLPGPEREVRDEAVFGTRSFNDVAVGTFVHDCLNRAPSHSRLTYYRLILKYWRPILETVKVPWFIPESYGGLGFPSISVNGDLNVSGYCIGPSSLDRQIATSIFNAMESGDVPRTPARVRAREPFRLHQYIMGGRLKNFTQLFHRDDPEFERGQNFYGKLVFAAFLHAPLLDLFDVDDGKFFSKQAVQHNIRIWSASSYKSLINVNRSLTVERIWLTSNFVLGLRARPERLHTTPGSLTPNDDCDMISADDEPTDDIDLQIYEGPYLPCRRGRVSHFADDLHDPRLALQQISEELVYRHGRQQRQDPDNPLDTTLAGWITSVGN